MLQQLRKSDLSKSCRSLTVLICILVAICYSVLFLVNKTPTIANSAAQGNCHPNGQNTLCDFLEFDGDQFVKWLESHETDDYYIGTPYLSLPLTDGEPHPNGDTKGGRAGMQCNGFVAHALNKVGANDSKFGNYGSPFSSYVYGINAWLSAIDANDIQSYGYETVEELLNDGHAEKGDIIICAAKDYTAITGYDKYGNVLDGHIGVFWGSSPSDNVFWHSSHSSNGFEQIPDCNQLSHIIPKADSDFILVKLRNKGWIEGTKTSANTSITNPNGQRNACYSLEGAVYSIYDDGWGCNNKVSEMVTNSEGYMKSEMLPAKTYYLKETTPPTGYAPNLKVSEAVVSGGKVTVLNGSYEASVSDQPKSAQIDILLKKVDEERNQLNNSELPQGEATLKGAKFEVSYFDVDGQENKQITKSEYDSFVRDHPPTKTWTFLTDEEGCCHLDDAIENDALYRNPQGQFCIPLGTVAIREVEAPTGYINNNEDVVWMRSIAGDGDCENVETFNALVDDSSVDQKVKRGDVQIQKVDEESEKSVPQGEASLAGIRFAIKNASSNAVMVDGKEYAKGEVVCEIETGEDGIARTVGNTDDCGEYRGALPYGKYTIEEVSSNSSYQLTDKSVQTFTISENCELVKIVETFKDRPVEGEVLIEKRDAESQLLTPLGGASIDGTLFNISLKENGQNPVKVDGKWVSAGQVVKTLTIKEGRAASGCILPYATYVIQEVKSGEGYRLTDGVPREFSIRTQGQQVKYTEGNAFYNEVYRGDLEWVKIENGTNSTYQNPLANVPFIIRSKTTGEEHVIVTDDNGQAKTQSDWNKHSDKTNENDKAVTKNADSTYSVNESKLDSSAGVWFGQKSSTDKALVPVQDDEGALPYDEYEIQELSVSSNKGYRLVTRSARVYKDTDKVSLGTITNEVEPYGGIRIFKTSSLPTTMSLAGAEFEIYTDPSMTKEFFYQKIVTDESGVARTGDTFSVPGNTRYWIKETKAPIG